jgi:3-carboxy-cis,cis-muconate cycloisomerase
VEYAGDPAHGPLLGAEFARELGLPEAVSPWHVLRTPIADVGAVAAFVTGALGKFAIDVAGLSRTEVGEVTESPSVSRPRSAPSSTTSPGRTVRPSQNQPAPTVSLTA